ncbi:hypothetical protein ARMGADRAFT_1039211 [Armillaria gallica]|uniref:Uncharacterized protein n=1 Tax=Armillaria gallica TaxID=47427 RepID=A0A2H3CZV7_ARMGA|nr:hypothetical protein ARMGADRAFT_1039211 [Armillaria gallica]
MRTNHLCYFTFAKRLVWAVPFLVEPTKCHPQAAILPFISAKSADGDSKATLETHLVKQTRGSEIVSNDDKIKPTRQVDTVPIPPCLILGETLELQAGRGFLKQFSFQKVVLYMREEVQNQYYERSSKLQTIEGVDRGKLDECHRAMAQRMPPD